MPIANSGPISMDDIQNQFGGSNPIELSEYYAGGAYVPSGTTGINGPIPSSGAIGFHHFYGAPQPAGGVSINSTNSNLIKNGIGFVRCRYRLTNTGLAYRSFAGQELVLIGGWVTSGVPTDYQVRATSISYDQEPPNGTFDTWLNFDFTREWILETYAGFYGDYHEKNATILIEIRNATTLAIVDTATIVMLSIAEYN